jgi:hypothetical protein
MALTAPTKITSRPAKMEPQHQRKAKIDLSNMRNMIILFLAALAVVSSLPVITKEDHVPAVSVAMIDQINVSDSFHLNLQVNPDIALPHISMTAITRY